MDRSEHRKLREYISEHMELAEGRFRTQELEDLKNFIDHFEDYGRNEEHHSFRDFSSEGRYTREEQIRYTPVRKDGKIFINEDYSFKDDDGYSGQNPTVTHRTARAILKALQHLNKQ